LFKTNLNCGKFYDHVTLKRYFLTFSCKMER